MDPFQVEGGDLNGKYMFYMGRIPWPIHVKTLISWNYDIQPSNPDVKEKYIGSEHTIDNVIGALFNK